MASVDKRTWRNAAGKTVSAYRVRFLDEYGKRRERQFAKRSDAVKFAEGTSALRAAGTIPIAARNTITFAEFAEHFLTACSNGRDGAPPLEVRTIEGYRYKIEHRLNPVLGALPIATVTADHVKTARDSLLVKWARPQARRTMSLLRTVMQFAVDEKVIDRNPSRDVRVPVDRRREAPGASVVAIHTREEMVSILTASARLAARPGKHDWKKYDLMLRVLIFAGLRMSELRGLPSDAVEGSMLCIRQRADLYGTLGPPKSQHGFRSIHIPSDLADEVRAYITSHGRSLAFGTATDKPMGHQNFTDRVWRRAQKEAGVRVLKAHSARHFYVSCLIDQGLPLKGLQEQVGHHDPMFTLRVYGHLFTSPADLALRQAMTERMSTSLKDLVTDDDDSALEDA